MATAVLSTFSSMACSTFRHNPYAANLLPRDDVDIAERSCASLYGTLSENCVNTKEPVTSSSGFALPVPASVAAARAQKEAALEGSCLNEEGVSDASSAEGDSLNNRSPTDERDILTKKLGVMPPVASSTVYRYASVNFRFGSAWFVAPFRTQAGDMVVVQYPGNNNSLHMGIVSCFSTAKPETFYTRGNMHPNYLTEEELAVLPRLLRHARDFDKETKMDLRNHDMSSLRNAQALAVTLGAPVTFLDAEWLLDLSAVTFLVHVHGDASLVDRLADELAAQEGAEVVFTYPAAPQLS